MSRADDLKRLAVLAALARDAKLAKVADAALARSRSLQQLAALSGNPTVFPGHWYSSEPSASLSEVKATNYVYRVSDLEQWRAAMGA